jgi:DNA-binding transcriptional ArsR family regulator
MHRDLFAAATRDVPARVLRYVADHEGAHFRAIQRDLGLSTGQADHHLRRFVQGGVLARIPLAGEVHFFPATRPRAERKPLAALRHPARAAIVHALLGSPPRALRALVEATAIPESTLAHHLKVLLRAGVVFKVEERGRVAYGLSDPSGAADLLADATRSSGPPQGPGQGMPPAD